MEERVAIMEETRAFISGCKLLVQELEGSDDYSDEHMDKIEHLYGLLNQAKDELRG
tara:strand:+ start:267 stop:434 length:168 start_codon:yes stop_codon:yes gene_type:complete